MTIEKIKSATFKTEDQFQVAVNLMVSQNFPQLRDKYWHTQNEHWIRRIAIKKDKNRPDSDYSNWRVETDSELEKRRMIEGSQSKAKGMKSGIMDWLIVHLGILYKLEIKIEGGRLSDSQKELKIIFENDCPHVPVCVAYDLYTCYLYFNWILNNGLSIDTRNYKKFII
jgi:hypothetical protein